MRNKKKLQNIDLFYDARRRVVRRLGLHDGEVPHVLKQRKWNLKICNSKLSYKAFRHVETLFVQGNQVRTDQNKPPFLLIKNKGLF